MPIDKKKMEIKNIALAFAEIKEIKDDTGNYGEFSGYAAAYGNKDQGGDIIEFGAAKKFLKESGPKWPILNNHDPYDQIGYNLEAEEMQKGLKVKGQINLNVQSGLERFALAKQAKENDLKHGLSIGYTPILVDYDKEKDVRTIKEMKLWEYSFVTFPMNPKAQVDSVKFFKIQNLLNNKEFSRLADKFLEDLQSEGFGKEVAHEALENCVKEEATFKEILEIIKETKKIFLSVKK